MRLARRLEFESCVLCILGAVAVLLSVYQWNWVNPNNNALGISTLGFTLHRLGTLGLSAWYATAVWALTVSAIVCVLGGLAIAGAFRVRQARLLGLLAIAACAVVVLALCLYVGTGPGLAHDPSELDYPRGPAVWVGVCGAGLVLFGFALALLARRVIRPPAVPSGDGTPLEVVNTIGD